MLTSGSRCALAAALLLASAGVAGAQAVPQEPIGRFVADARGVFARFPDDPIVAGGIQIPPADLPTRGLGVVVGAHVYPFRLGALTLGVGGEMLLARGSKAKVLPPAGDGEPLEGPKVTTRLSVLSPHVSLNFGSRDGWSYISGGMGWSAFTAEREELPLPDPESRARTIHYGGGARWFTRKHLAVSLDLRFYAMSPQVATARRPAYPRMRLLVLSGGVAFK